MSSYGALVHSTFTSGVGKTRGKQDRPGSNMGVYVKVKGRRSGDGGRGAGA